ncbi:MAG: serine/threonine phosphatase [Kaiparowitsia implicata GSE-PSE-MK54-09C]|jgi:protein phosphatase|nr:serine/threonine phosphatase [Kaiparowitsia implicata GSE-PSE-MK54-09C]
MLVCPECQFENPDSNRFCQRCGTPLSEKPCPACGTLVALDAEHCPACNAFTATVRRAVVMAIAPTVSPDAAESTVAAPSPIPALAYGDYLDTAQRYRCLEPSADDTITHNSYELRVMDCHPFQSSALDLLFRHPELLNVDENPSPDAGDNPFELEIETLGLPEIALRYLELEEQLYPSLPQVRDAWTQGAQAIVILEDRSELLPITAAWADPNNSPFQLLHVLHQVTELWTVLQPQGFAQSLLEPVNLKVDEDQLLYLQRLYLDADDRPPQLSDLGDCWQPLIDARSPEAELQPLLALCADLTAGAIASVAELRSSLEAIARTLSPSEPLPEPLAVTSDMAAAPISEDDDITIALPAAPSLPTTAPPASGFDPADLPAVNDRANDRSAADVSVSASPTLLELNDADDADLGAEGEDMPTVVLPLKLVQLEDAGSSDVGRQREHNEDFFSIRTDIRKVETLAGRSLQARGLYILCDGMGGHASGEVASAMAAKTLADYFQQHWIDELPSAECIRDGVLQANHAIFEQNQQNDSAGSGRMGTTVVVVLVQNMRAAIAHVGDSRLYRYGRQQGLEQVTVDHKVGQREVQRGVEAAIAYARPDAYQLTQALGPRDAKFVSPDVQFLDITEDTLLLLCSDGLSDNDLLEKHCDTHVKPLLSSTTNLDSGVSQLIDLANQQNGHDNITVVAVRAKLRPNLESMPR